MNINRRQLLCLLLVRPPQSTSLQVSVLEVFAIDDRTQAVLVNHASESSRKTTDEETDATIFRVRMCFGRGLILLSQPITIREGEVLTLVT
jgi:hypothetical protein